MNFQWELKILLNFLLIKMEMLINNKCNNNLFNNKSNNNLIEIMRQKKKLENFL